MKRLAWAALGIIFSGLAFVGVVVPLLPTTPLILLAAFCFGRSSDRLYCWFTDTRLYKNNIAGLVRDRVMTLRAKIVLLATITVLMGGSFLLMRVVGAPVLPQVVLGVVWAAHVLFFAFWVKT